MSSPLLRAAVALALVAATTSARADEPTSCFPACRSGYLCHEGRCVSACNPPCDAGQTCTAAGECQAAVPAAPLPATFDPAVTPAVQSAPAADPGWARGAFYFGAVSTVLDVGLTTAIVLTNPHEPGRSRTIGSWSIALFGMTTPLTALGAASARGTPAVVGRPRLRVAAWVAYGLALIDSAYLLSKSRVAVIDNRYVVGAGVLGTFSTLGFTLDAHASATQAEALRARTTLTFGLAPTAAGGLAPTWGLAGAF